LGLIDFDGKFWLSLFCVDSHTNVLFNFCSPNEFLAVGIKSQNCRRLSRATALAVGSDSDFTLDARRFCDIILKAEKRMGAKIALQIDFELKTLIFSRYLSVKANY
jgi:hypothetical protein